MNALVQALKANEQADPQLHVTIDATALMLSELEDTGEIDMGKYVLNAEDIQAQLAGMDEAKEFSELLASPIIGEFVKHERIDEIMQMAKVGMCEEYAGRWMAEQRSAE